MMRDRANDSFYFRKFRQGIPKKARSRYMFQNKRTERRELHSRKIWATLAQLVERLIRNQQVASSILAGGSSNVFECSMFSESPLPGVRQICFQL